MFKQLNLFLAAFWVCCGVGLLAYDAVTGQVRLPMPLLGGISVAWLCLVLAGYNALRWYAGRRRSAPPVDPVNPLRTHRRADPEPEAGSAFTFEDRPPQPPPSDN
jgi:hypothetical protein